MNRAFGHSNVKGEDYMKKQKMVIYEPRREV